MFVYRHTARINVRSRTIHCALCVDDGVRSLYGFFLAQTQYYFHEYPSDRLYIQIMVRFNVIRIVTSVDQLN